eukprot:COSAG05_NODE_3773_length_1843_cov_5.338876_2_plen_127_part_00
MQRLDHAAANLGQCDREAAAAAATIAANEQVFQEKQTEAAVDKVFRDDEGAQRKATMDKNKAAKAAGAIIPGEALSKSDKTPDKKIEPDAFPVQQVDHGWVCLQAVPGRSNSSALGCGEHADPHKF